MFDINFSNLHTDLFQGNFFSEEKVSTQTAYGNSTKHINGREEDSKRKRSIVMSIAIDRWCLSPCDFGLMNELPGENCWFA